MVEARRLLQQNLIKAGAGGTGGVRKSSKQEEKCLIQQKQVGKKPP